MPLLVPPALAHRPTKPMLLLHIVIRVPGVFALWWREQNARLQFEVMKLNPVSGDAAFMTGRFNLERGKRKSSGIFTLVFRKIDARWVIVYDHTSQSQPDS